MANLNLEYLNRCRSLLPMFNRSVEWALFQQSGFTQNDLQRRLLLSTQSSAKILDCMVTAKIVVHRGHGLHVPICPRHEWKQTL